MTASFTISAYNIRSIVFLVTHITFHIILYPPSDFFFFDNSEIFRSYNFFSIEINFLRWRNRLDNYGSYFVFIIIQCKAKLQKCVNAFKKNSMFSTFVQVLEYMNRKLQPHDQCKYAQSIFILT